MIPLLVEVAVGNLVASAVLAAIAYLVHRGGRHPSLAHLIGVLALLKLVTPPLVAVPLGLPVRTSSGRDGAGGGVLDASPVSSELTAAPWLDDHAFGLLFGVWALGSLVVLAVSIVRIVRFDRLLRRTSADAPRELVALAGGIAASLGMRDVPAIQITDASMAPLTWWPGHRVRVVLPQALLSHLPDDRIRWIVAHEMAHVRRHDHLVRWLEWLVTVTFWWNPVAWWARHNLHQDEEVSCDAMVIERLDAPPRAYAGAVLAVVELLSQAPSRPPSVATGIDGAGSLERRFARIAASRPTSRARRAAAITLVALSTLVLPLGVGSGVDPGTVRGTTEVAPDQAGGSDPSVDDTAREQVRSIVSALRSARDRAATVGSTDTRQRRLAAAARKLERAEQALERASTNPTDAGRLLRRAQRAVTEAERLLEGGRATPAERELRQTRKLIKQAMRSSGGVP